MANLAIKGHPTRGKEVIELLEMLGGSNPHNYSADCGSLCFHIGENTNSIYYDWVRDCYEDGNTLVFTLEEFLEKFPYKVGDKVQHNGATSCGSVYVIEQIKWEDNQLKYIICDLYWKNCKCTVISKDLQPYKEETNMKESTKLNLSAIDYNNGLVGYEIPEGYEFDTVIDNKVVIKKSKPQYPKTYEECCKVLMGETNFQDFSLALTKLSTNINEENSISPEPPHITLINNFYKLLICRDAYWKIAGEEMELGKPWEPDYRYRNEYYSIYYNGFSIIQSNSFEAHTFIFPTEEMRDAFYENFRELIEQCKELP